MPFTRHSPATLAIGLLLSTPGCLSPTEDAPAPASSRLVAGLTVDPPLLQSIVRLKLQAEAPPGTTIYQEQLSGEDAAAFPREVPLPPLPAGTPVTFTAIADTTGEQSIISRHITYYPDGPTARLLRVRLNDECLSESDPCSATERCAGGLCLNAFQPPHTLEPYQADWWYPQTDACHSGDGTDAWLTICDGAAPYEPLVQGQAMMPEPGLQGAAHIFLSVRMNNLLADGTVTAVSGQVLQTGQLNSTQSIASPYTPIGEGCELRGVRYVLPFAGAYENTIKLRVAVIDSTGNASLSQIDVNIETPAAPMP